MALPEGFGLVREDAIAWLAELDAGVADLLITDPPYESLEKHRAVGTTTRLKKSKSSSNPWFDVFPNHAFGALFDALFRAARRDSHLYMFCDHVTFPLAAEAGQRAGFRFWKPLVWDKKRIGMGYHYRCRYEFILFFEKGKRKLNSLSIPDVLECPRVIGGYPTEKPVSLLETLILQSSVPGELVVDPFMGSGSAGAAALKTGRLFRGCDKSTEAVAYAERRLNEMVQGRGAGAA
jgi:site-specific DNA-methyltransferase (adenine-specific)